MILVYCELKDGSIRKPSLEALSEARRLVDSNGLQVGALFVGAACAGAEAAAQYGADAILQVQAPSLAAYSSDGYAQAIADAVRAKGATVLGTGEPRIGAHGVPVIFVHPKDMGGVLVELMQTPTEAH